MNHKQGGIYFWQGNEACVQGALFAGCKFFAGYPITPATEISESMAKNMPRVGGIFVQGEDELASLAMVIGASHAGLKAMTASSGNGISLMQEEIGYACISETPCVIVDCQRVGTGTGIATKSMQGDIYQARYGSNGDYSIIALAPDSPQEMFELTVQAFNLAEQYRTPVFILADEIVAHMREKVVVNPESLSLINRKKPDTAKNSFIPFRVEEGEYVPPMPSFGDGYAIPVSSFVRTETGAPTTHYGAAEKLLRRLWEKIECNTQLRMFERVHLKDAKVAVVSYGSVSRSSREAVCCLRNEGLPVGLLKLSMIWPFPDEIIYETANQVEVILVPEMNMGKLVREVQRAAEGRAEVIGLTKAGVELHRPKEILDMVKKVIK